MPALGVERTSGGPRYAISGALTPIGYCLLGLLCPTFSVSSVMKLAKSAGVIDFGTLSTPANRDNIFGSASAASIAMVKLIDYFCRRVLWCDQTIPHACLIARYKLPDGRHVR
jgi:hypothetical protein